MSNTRLKSWVIFQLFHDWKPCVTAEFHGPCLTSSFDPLNSDYCMATASCFSKNVPLVLNKPEFGYYDKSAEVFQIRTSPPSYWKTWSFIFHYIFPCFSLSHYIIPKKDLIQQVRHHNKFKNPNEESNQSGIKHHEVSWPVVNWCFLQWWGNCSVINSYSVMCV